jgi:hypothetical protein
MTLKSLLLIFGTEHAYSLVASRNWRRVIDFNPNSLLTALTFL